MTFATAMAVVSLMNQTRYRKTFGSKDRISNDNETSELWVHQSPDGATGCCSKSLESRLRYPRLSGCCMGQCCEQGDVFHRCTIQTCERISINVSGQYYETWASMLNRHPSTLLGSPKKRLQFYDRRKDEYFFDRHRPTFEAIFNYYQYGGKLKRPEPVPDDIFLQELEFFEIEKEVVDKYKREEGYIAETVILPENDFQRKLWMIMEFPETSCLAYVIAVTSVIVTLVSIILFCVETLPVFSVTHCISGQAPNFMDVFFIVESICTGWFTVEVVVRFIASPRKIRYFQDFKNIVDITAVVPYYVTLFNVLASMNCETAKSSASLAFLRVIRLVRIFKLTKHSSGLQVLILTFKASVQGLCLFFVALIVCILLFSSAIYYAEHGVATSEINSIPDAFWWAVITMTTVGYGDRVPKGPLGKFIGSICAIAGVLTLAIPVPIVTENFNKFYSHKTGRGKL